MLIKGAKVHTLAWRVLLALLAMGSVGVLLYQQRHLLVSFLRLPHACGLGTGCVDLSPALATAVMFGFDAVLVALAVWQLNAGRFFSGDARADGTGWQWPAGLALVGAAAMATRFLVPELKQLRWDETHMAWLAIDAMLEGRLPLTGINSSAEIPNLPGSVYLVAPVLVPFLDRPGAIWAMLALSGLAGVSASLLCAWFVRRWLGSPRAGLAAGIAFALGFWPVFMGRRLWQQVLLPPFAVLYLDAVLLLAARRQPSALVWAVGWLVLLVHLHFTSIALLPVALLASWLARKRLRFAHASASIALAAVLLFPFLWWEASFSTSFNDLKQAAIYWQRPSTIDVQAIRSILNLASAGFVEEQVELFPRAAGGELPASTTEALAAQVSQFADLPIRLSGAGAILFLMGVLGLSVLAVQHRRKQIGIVALFLLAWCLVPILVFTRHTLPIAQFYFYYLVPAIAICIGVAVGWTELAERPRWTRLRTALRLSTLPLLAAYAAGSVLTLELVLSINDRLRTIHYDVPAGYLTAAGTAAYKAWRATSPGQPILIGAQERDVEKLRLALGPAIPAVAFDDCREVLVPEGVAGRLIYFLRDDTPGARYLAQHDQTVAIARVARPGASAYQVLSVSAAATTAVRFADDERWDWPDCYERYVQQ